MTFLSSPDSHIWIHVIMNYLGLDDTDTIHIYFNGAEVDVVWMDSFPENSTAGYGRIVVGREFTDQDRNYASLQVDELIFFNQALNNSEIQLIYNST